MRLTPGLSAVLTAVVLLYAGAARGTSPHAPLGTWSGTVRAPQGNAPITLAFARDSAGAVHLLFDFPVMHCAAVRFDEPVAWTDTAGAFALLDLRWRIAGARLSGTFGRGRLPMELRPGGRMHRSPAAARIPQGPAPLWRYALGASTRATPVVRDGIAYVGAANGEMHAVRVDEGTRLWRWSGPHPIDGTACVSGDAVFVVDRGLDLVCLARADGSLRWRTALHDTSRTRGPAPENATFTRRVGTPLVVDGHVLAGSSDGGLYALDAATGAIAWRHDAGTPVFSSVARVGGDTLSFGGMDGSLVLFDLAGRRELVRVHAGGPVVSPPVVSAGRLVAGSRDYAIHAFELADTTRGWRFSYWFSWVESTPAAEGTTLWFGASDFRRVTALDARTGRARWSTDVLGMTWGTPLVTPRVVYAATAAQDLPGTVIAHEGGIVALDRATGRRLWRWAAPPPAPGGFGGFAGSLALAGDRIVAAGFDGVLLALPIPERDGRGAR